MIVKICGITSTFDAVSALDAGADWIGLNLVAGPRRIEPTRAAEIVSALPDAHRAVVLVALESGRISEPVEDVLRQAGVSRLQIYGDTNAGAVAELLTGGFEVIVVQQIVDATSFEALDRLLGQCGAARPTYALLDAPAGSRLGGTGRRADWDLIARTRNAGQMEDWPPVLLAGGLTPDNVADAVATLRPSGVDVSSGVESAPGSKDAGKVRAFIAAARAAG